jgi:hypothetical protein
MFRRIVMTLVISGMVFGGSVGSASAVVEWELIDESVSLGMNGVSPHVEKVAGGDRVWRSDMVPSGTAVSLCNDAGSCSTESLTFAEAGGASDFAISQTASGLRAYFKRIEMSTNTQAVYSAPCVTSDCLSVGAATLASSGMRVSKDQGAWGVPDPVRLPDGRTRIYIVESPEMTTSCPEKVASYISSDGITFTKESGWRLEGGYVDTEVLRAKNGEWLMIMADGPGCPAGGSRKLQQLYVSESTDGLSWSKPQVLTNASQGRLDPTGYEVSANVFRIYYAAGGANNTFTLKRATLRIKSTPAGSVGITNTPKVTAPSNKSKTITCVKGKTVRKVTGTTCPKGFTKK